MMLPRKSRSSSVTTLSQPDVVDRDRVLEALRLLGFDTDQTDNQNIVHVEIDVGLVRVTREYVIGRTKPLG